MTLVPMLSVQGYLNKAVNCDNSEEELKMKIDVTSVRKQTAQAPSDCLKQISEILSADESSIADFLINVKTWSWSKSELCHWIPVLNRFDDFLAQACVRKEDNEWRLHCDQRQEKLVIGILQFTALLFENTFSRDIYNSMEHIVVLLESSSISILAATLNLINVFSKRSTFLSRLSKDLHEELKARMLAIVETWGGPEFGLTLSICCRRDVEIPSALTTLTFDVDDDEINLTNPKNDNDKGSSRRTIRFVEVHKQKRTPAQWMQELISKGITLPADKKFLLFHRLRVAYAFGNFETRLLMVICRLKAVAISVYISSFTDFEYRLLNTGLVIQMLDVLKLPDLPELMAVRAEVFRTLGTFFSHVRTGIWTEVVDPLGLTFFHGFLPTLTRSCVNELLEHSSNSPVKYPHYFSTALFSFLYYLAKYDRNGAQALTTSGTVEVLLKVVSSSAARGEGLTFVTRAVRIIEMTLTPTDSMTFQNLNGIQTFIHRLSDEIDHCRRALGHPLSSSDDSSIHAPGTSSSNVLQQSNDALKGKPLPFAISSDAQTLSFQSAALIKSLLSFMKKIIQDPQFSESVRHIMDSNFSNCLSHIIQNSLFYGPSLFLLAMSCVASFILQEPSQLSQLQERGLTTEILEALFRNEIPTSREIVSSLPNIFSALCLNERGVSQFLSYSPFKTLFTLLISPNYLNALRRVRSLEDVNNTAFILGSMIDQLLRHQPRLKSDAIHAVVEVCICDHVDADDRLLRQLAVMCKCRGVTCAEEADVSGRNRRRPQFPTEHPLPFSRLGNNDSDQSDPDDSESGPVPSLVLSSPNGNSSENSSNRNDLSNEQVVPLVDYFENVLKFLHGLFNRNQNDEHARLFLNLGGMYSLVDLIGCGNIPVDYMGGQLYYLLATICRQLYVVTHNPLVFEGIFSSALDRARAVKNIFSYHSKSADRPDVRHSVLVKHFPDGVQTVESTVYSSSQFSAVFDLFNHIYVLSCMLTTIFQQGENRAIILKTVNEFPLVETLVKVHLVLLLEMGCVASATEESVRRNGPVSVSQFMKDGHTLDAKSFPGANDILSMQVLRRAVMNELPNDSTTCNHSKKSTALRCFPMELYFCERLILQLKFFFGRLAKLTQTNRPGIPGRRFAQFADRTAVTVEGDKAMTHLVKTLCSINKVTISSKNLDACLYICTATLELLSDIFLDYEQLHVTPVVEFFQRVSTFQMLQNLSNIVDSDRLWLGKDKYGKSCGSDARGFISDVLVLIDKLIRAKYFDHRNESEGRSSFPNTPHPVIISSLSKFMYKTLISLWHRLPSSPKLKSDESLSALSRITLHALRYESRKIEERKSSEKSSVVQAEVEVIPEISQVVNPVHLQQLMDVGFSQQLATEALSRLPNVDQAAEYCLYASSNRALVQQDNQADVGDDEEQLRQAIALSLMTMSSPGGEQQQQRPPETQAAAAGSSGSSSSNQRGVDFVPEIRQQPSREEINATIENLLHNTGTQMMDIAESSLASIGRFPPLFEQIERQLEMEMEMEMEFEMEPRTSGRNILAPVISAGSNAAQMPPASSSDKTQLSKQASKTASQSAVPKEHDERSEAFLRFAEKDLLPSSILLLKRSPKLAAALTPLFSIVITLFGFKSVKTYLLIFCNRLCSVVTATMIEIEQMMEVHSEADRSATIPSDSRFEFEELSTLLNLLHRLFVQFQVPMAIMLHETKLLAKFQEFIVLIGLKSKNTTFLSFMSKRSQAWLAYILRILELHVYTCEVVDRLLAIPKCRNYIWKFWDRQWYCYSPSVNRKINDAFMGGDQYVYFSQGRRTYRIDFFLMIQFCYETNIIRKVICLRPENSDGNSAVTYCYHPFLNYVDMATFKKEDLGSCDKEILLNVAVEMIGSSVHAETLRGILRIILLLTRDHSRTKYIVFHGTIKRLFALDESQKFVGVEDMVMLLLRHIIEDPDYLQNLMEKPAAFELIKTLLEYIMTKQKSSVSSVVKDSRAEMKPSSSRLFQRESTEGESQLVGSLLFPKPLVMLYLAEIIQCYPDAASVVVNFRLNESGSLNTSDNRSPLAHILDVLIEGEFEEWKCKGQTFVDGVKAVFGSLSACVHCEESQAAVVSEIKAALARALALNNNERKHKILDNLMSLLCHIVEVCPLSEVQIPKDSKLPPPQNTKFKSILRWFVKKRLLVDLARIPHSLDLSDAQSVLTVNCMLKALDEISRQHFYPSRSRSIGTPAINYLTSNGQAGRRSLIRISETVDSAGHDYVFLNLASANGRGNSLLSNSFRDTSYVEQNNNNTISSNDLAGSIGALGDLLRQTLSSNSNGVRDVINQLSSEGREERWHHDVPSITIEPDVEFGYRTLGRNRGGQHRSGLPRIVQLNRQSAFRIRVTEPMPIVDTDDIFWRDFFSEAVRPAERFVMFQRSLTDTLRSINFGSRLNVTNSSEANMPMTTEICGFFTRIMQEGSLLEMDSTYLAWLAVREDILKALEKRRDDELSKKQAEALSAADSEDKSKKSENNNTSGTASQDEPGRLRVVVRGDHPRDSDNSSSQLAESFINQDRNDDIEQEISWVSVTDGQVLFEGSRQQVVANSQRLFQQQQAEQEQQPAANNDSNPEIPIVPDNAFLEALRQAQEHFETPGRLDMPDPDALQEACNMLIMTESDLVQGRVAAEEQQQLQQQEPQENVESNADAAVAADATTAAPETAETEELTEEQRRIRDILGDTPIPEGVDRAFLAELPENIRAEVIAEQWRLLRLQQQSRSAEGTDGSAPPAISMDFLVALPPELQEENNPDGQMDLATFFETLPAPLRRQILSDADESQMAFFPSHIAAEARHIQLTFNNRETDSVRPRHGIRLARRPVPADMRSLRQQLANWNRDTPSYNRTQFGGHTGSKSASTNTTLSTRSSALFDRESLTCLLVLLFVDDSRLSTARLTRILRTVCAHPGTREWLLRALVSILQRTWMSLDLVGGSTLGGVRPSDPEFGDLSSYCFSPTPSRSTVLTRSSHRRNEAAGAAGGLHLSSANSENKGWLSMTMTSKLGNCVEVFRISKPTASGGKRALLFPQLTPVLLHPLVVPAVSTAVINTIAAIAKSYSHSFFPQLRKLLNSQSNAASTSDGASASTAEAGSTAQQSGAARQGDEQQPQSASKTPTLRRRSSSAVDRMRSDFWDILTKLNNPSSANSRTKHSPKIVSFGFPDTTAQCGVEDSLFGQLVLFLRHPVIVERQGLQSILLSTLQHVTSASLAQISDTILDQGVFLEEQLKLLIDVLVRDSSSGDNRNDARLILVRCAAALGPATRRRIFELLFEAARELAGALRKELIVLLEEMRSLKNNEPGTSAQSVAGSSSSSSGSALLPARGRMIDRFTGTTLVVSSTSPAKAPNFACSQELQCPSMELLSKKNSMQTCLLRVINSILSMKHSMKKFDERDPNFEQDVTSFDFELHDSEEVIDDSDMSAGDRVRDRRNGSSSQEEGRQENTASVESAPATTTTAGTDASSTTVTASSAATPTTTTSDESSTATVAAPVTPVASAGVEVSDSNAPLGTITSTSITALSSGDGSRPVFELEAQPLTVSMQVDNLWDLLSECLTLLDESADPHAVLILQPAVEAFFIIHGDDKRHMNELCTLLQSSTRPDSDTLTESSASNSVQPFSDMTVSSSDAMKSSDPHFRNLPLDVQMFIRFAEKHRTVLNQIIRQSKTPLNTGPFSVLINYTRILDFDIKRRYFRLELERVDQTFRADDTPVRVKRDRIFQDSFRELFRLRPSEWKSRFYILFDGEEGQDAGGLLREWFSVITREIFDPNYALFMTASGDSVTYTINPSSYINREHLQYFKFIGRLIAKAIYDNKLLDCYFTRAFYKHILSKPVKYTDIESEDPSFYQSMVFLLENPVSTLGYDLTFSLEVEEFGVREIRDLKPEGRTVLVTDANKMEYVRLVCQMKMTGAIRQQLNAFLEGFYDIIPRRLISIFNEQELELLISGLPIIDIDDLQQNTEYYKYNKNSLQIQWFWRAVRSFDHAERAKLLQFVTGTSRVPLQGFAALPGMHGAQRFQIHRDDRSVDRLPAAHTWYLDLPPYETYDKLRHMLLLAINECSEGFGR
ncbi:E3 ubiquitin-protein ligase HUWE1 [Trichinella murrelli]|uniref:HECT-type E3 ubiquitin transferase n=1 Tax=Trichinella murrelli TaxID=144512 RepID=A0A0V0U2I1_9BILA|nr:E3 ubiquitin-protein ligase HUWE1 [Trichinella murrelli]